MNNSWNRRDFIVKPVAVLAASQLLGAQELFAENKAAGKIIQRKLGRTGISLPVVSMGVMNANMPAVVKRAYEVGIRHYDTAARYQDGRNEEMLGAAIKELGVRKQLTIATKVHIQPPKRRDADVAAQMRASLEGSLRRLQTDYVDLLHWHNIAVPEDVGLEAVLRTLEAFKKEGKTRFIGISSHGRADEALNEVTRLDTFDAALVSFNYTMANNPKMIQAIHNAAQKGIGIIAMKSQAGGLTKPDPKLPQPLPPHSQTALLKWVLRNPDITTAIPGFTTFDQLEQNISVAYDLAYTPAEREFLGDKTYLAQAQFCRQCGSCIPDCPHHVDVPELMRSHMYAMQYGNHHMAHQTIAAIPAGRGLGACASCAECVASCRHSVNIASKIAELKYISA